MDYPAGLPGKSVDGNLSRLREQHRAHPRFLLLAVPGLVTKFASLPRLASRDPR